MNSTCMSKIELSPGLSRLEQELREKDRLLQEEIKKRKQAELIKEQLQAQIQEQERLAVVGQLAAGIVHDFNNIMAVILLMTQLLRRTVNLSLPARKHLQTIEQQARTANDLIQQILGFCRHVKYEKKALNLKSFLNELVKLLNHVLPDNIQVESRLGPEEYFIYADSSHIQQVIMNLALNARDSLPDGGKLLFILERLRVGFNYLPGMPAGEWIQITVQDNGVGIPQDILPHIFEPYFTTKPPGKGTGLGLTQVRNILRQHGAFFDVQSEPQSGTTFRIFFPALATTFSDANTAYDPDLTFGQGETVLVVEDNPDTLAALVDSLNHLNYQVLAASNGRQALALLLNPKNQIDLVLSDVIMPEMGGPALLKAIIQQGLGTPLLLLTGNPMAEEINALLDQGLTGWLPKPVSLDRLASGVAQALAAAPPQNENKV